MSGEVIIGLFGLLGGLITGMIELRRARLNAERGRESLEAALALERQKQTAETERMLREQVSGSMKMMHEQNQNTLEEWRRLIRVNEQLALDNSRNLELRAEAEMKAQMLEGQINQLSVQLDKARVDLMKSAEMVGQYQVLQGRQEQLESSLRRVEKMYSEVSEQNRSLKNENSQLKEDKTRLIKQVEELTTLTSQLEQKISELTQRIDQLEKEKLAKGHEHAATIVAIGTAIGDIPSVGGQSGIGSLAVGGSGEQLGHIEHDRHSDRVSGVGLLGLLPAQG